MALALSSCANYRALRDIKEPPPPGNDPDLIRALGEMHPHLSIETPRAKPGTNWQQREVIVWLKGSVVF